jgi:hypothetical protein
MRDAFMRDGRMVYGSGRAVVVAGSIDGGASNPLPHCGALTTTAIDRRLLLGLVGAVGVGVASISKALAAGGTDALLLNCIDYRLTGFTGPFMADQGLRGKYDQLVLAGASLAATNKKFPAWGTTFWDHLKFAVDVHHVHELMVVDHRDCGAYKLIFNKDFAKNPAEEFEVHATNMRALRAEVSHRHPQLQVKLFLMALDGKVETVT